MSLDVVATCDLCAKKYRTKSEKEMKAHGGTIHDPRNGITTVYFFCKDKCWDKARDEWALDGGSFEEQPDFAPYYGSDY